MLTSNESSGFDQVSDTNGAIWHTIKTAYALPDEMTDTVAGLEAPPQTIRRKDYADSVYALFPLHNPSHVKASAAYFYHQRHTMPADRAHIVEQRIKLAAQYFSIHGEVDNLAKLIVEKQAYTEEGLPDEDFALVWFDTVNQTKDRQYPLRNPTEVKIAATYLTNNRLHFAYADRRTMAMKVLQKAATMGVAVPEKEILTRTAGGGVCSAETMADVILDRARQMKNAGMDLEIPLAFVQEAKPFVEAARKAPLPPSELAKVANLVDSYDRRTHLNLRNELIEDQLFIITPDNAGRIMRDHVAIKTGAIYELDRIAQLPLNRLREVMGDTFTKEISFSDIFVERGKAADYLPSLSLQHAQLFEQTAKAMGLEPTYRQPAAPVAIDPTALVELANLFPQY